MRKPFKNSSDKKSDSKPRKFGSANSDKKSKSTGDSRDKKSRSSDSDKPFKKKFSDRPDSDRAKKTTRDSSFSEKRARPDSDKPVKKKFDGRSTFGRDKKVNDDGNSSLSEKPKRQDTDKKPFKKKPAHRFGFDRDKKPKGDPLPSFSENVRLNKYLANAGICSRREADVLIQTGLVKVNDVIITELGYKVKPDDIVKYDGGTVRAEKKRYVLLNKPKDFITTMDDPMDRKTVMVLVAKACKERIYPVGRLDRNTTGVLLFTNDGDLAKKLTHPRYEVRKIYHVETVEAVTYEQIHSLTDGVELEDGGFVKADKAEILKESNNREVGIEIHSGKYRVVRRMFEALGHTVKKLDRVSFAGLTKKDLPRGNYRHLTPDEVNYLMML